MLKLENISKSYGEKTLFRDFSYTFPDKGIYAICGESGAGKTTLIRIISGLETNFSGKVNGGGISNTSVCFQEHRLFPTLNALENITKISFSKCDQEKEKAALSLLRYLSFSEEDTRLYPKELSGGMRQRISFARAVMRSSPILILDEATKEIDGSIREKMLDIIKEEASRRLVLIISHNDEELSALGAIKVKISQ